MVRQSEEGGAAGLGAELFLRAAGVPEPQHQQTAPPAGCRLHLHAAQSALPVHLLLPGPSQPLSMCSGTHTLITDIYVVNTEDSDFTESVRVTHSFVSNPLWAGELALEEHRRTGPAVDAEVSKARLVHQLLPHSL